jgi:hypothetical protein
MRYTYSPVFEGVVGIEHPIIHGDGGHVLHGAGGIHRPPAVDADDGACRVAVIAGATAWTSTAGDGILRLTGGIYRASPPMGITSPL